MKGWCEIAETEQRKVGRVIVLTKVPPRDPDHFNRNLKIWMDQFEEVNQFETFAFREMEEEEEGTTVLYSRAASSKKGERKRSSFSLSGEREEKIQKTESQKINAELLLLHERKLRKSLGLKDPSLEERKKMESLTSELQRWMLKLDQALMPECELFAPF